MAPTRIPVEKAVKVTLLGEPLQFLASGKQAKNRFLKAAMSERLATYVHGNPKLTGVPTERLINVYDKHGHGGFGVICTGNVMVAPNHLEVAGNTVIAAEVDTPERREKFSILTKAAKADGALVIAQLSHSGAATPIEINPQPFSASDVEAHGFSKYGKPIPLTEAEIQTEVVDRFRYAAKFCKEVGFDGVELHASYLYLLAQFLTPTANKRTDKYGGSAENRVRVVLEIYEAIR
ncbi:Protein F17A9.4 [Aphelenchoides avenae]|nr:Protein F17A9.4 [Aphelenchus avenae]